jgi:serine/threonine protein kinase
MSLVQYGVPGLTRGCCAGSQEDVSEARPIHATFHEKVQQLAGASEEFQQEAVDFVRALLQTDPGNRLTAEEALLHPFLTKEFLSVAPDSLPPITLRKEFALDTSFESDLWVACMGICNKHVDSSKEDATQ